MEKPLFVYSMLFGYITGLLVLVKESGTKSRKLRPGFEKTRPPVRLAGLPVFSARYAGMGQEENQGEKMTD